jgi:hypothetical protein
MQFFSNSFLNNIFLDNEYKMYHMVQGIQIHCVSEYKTSYIAMSHSQSHIPHFQLMACQQK